MNINIAAALSLISWLASNSVLATTVQTCTLNYSGAMNAIDVENGVVTGIAKMFAKQTEGETFTLVAKNGDEHVRSGTITTTIDLTQFAADGQSCFFDNRFTPIHSISSSRPWRQFQMRFDSLYDSNIMTKYRHNGIETKLMVANGWTWGTDMASIHVFEFVGGEFFPVKFDIDQGNGELPPFRAGNTAMSTSGDGGLWQYRASAVSDDGRLVAGYAKLEESVNFDKGSVISEYDKFGMVWEIAESCSVDSNKCNGENASRLTSGSENTASLQVRSLSGSQINRNAAEKAVFSNGENITLDRSTLKNGQVLSFASIPTDFTIGYNFLTGVENVACTLIDAEGALTQNKRERIDPYVIYGDSNNGTDYHTRDKSIIDEGELTLSIAAYTDRDCNGEPFFNDSITLTINKTDSSESRGQSNEFTGNTSGEFYLVDRQVKSNVFEMLSYNPDSTMESVYGVTTIQSGKYIVNGRSVSGKPMVALVTL
jgi:hypothetical protein